MENEPVHKLAIEILNNDFLPNWQLYLIMLALAFVGAFFGSLIKGFGKEKSKYLAIESSLETIKKQVKLSTEVSEEIKSAIEHEVWRKKELELLRRKKLEEYFYNVSLLNDSLNHDMIAKYFDHKAEYNQEAWVKADLIQALYLPELEDEHLKLSKAVEEFQEWVSEGLFIIAKRNTSNDEAIFKQHMKKQPEKLKTLVNPIATALLKARGLARTINT